MSMNRTFRVFISSTFADFQIERELLRKFVWPELENFCRLRGATFEAIDLRWGIPANSAEELDIVSICLEEVERCQRLSPRPNFIALIGNRYGWRPLPVTIPQRLFNELPSETQSLIRKHYNSDENAVPPVYLVNKSSFHSAEQENQLLIDIRRTLADIKRTAEQEDYFYKSATHLEIENGIFKPKIEEQEDYFFTCFRYIEEISADMDCSTLSESEKVYVDLQSDDNNKIDSEAGEWLNTLRSQISSKLQNNSEQIANYYTSLKELSQHSILPYMQQMCVDIEIWLKKKIIEELERLSDVTPLDLEIAEHHKFKTLRNTTFGGREKIIGEFLETCKTPDIQNTICINGDGGTGKSALISKLIDEIKINHPDSVVIYRFIGATPKSVELNYLLEGIVDELVKECNLPLEEKRITREEHVRSFNKVLNSITDKNIFLFIDALDQLNNTENAHSLYWLPQKLSPKTTLVLSVLNGPVERAVGKIYPAIKFIDLSPQKTLLQTGEIEMMLNSLLLQKPARSLTEQQKKYVIEKFNSNRLMLYLKLAAENARHWHSFDSIEEIERKKLGLKTSLESQIELLFDRLSGDENFGYIFVKHVLSFIALSREGVSQREIEDILWLDDEYRSEFDRRKHKNQPEVNALPPIIWARFFFEIEPFLMERVSGGTVVFDFFHRIFKVVIKSGISPEVAATVHQLLSEYFSDDKLHPIRYLTQNGSIVYNIRKLIELPFHQAAAGEIDKLHRTLTDFVFIDSKVKIGKTYELLEDYQSALECDKENKYSLLRLIAKSFRSESNFIAHHPETLFQSMYNNCWWHDHPDRLEFYEPGITNHDDHEEKLYRLMELWSNVNSALNPGFRWLKSLQPPPVLLDGAQLSLLRGLSSPVIFVSYSPDDKKIYAICNRGEFITWDADTQNIEQFIPLSEEKSFMFKPNSKTRFDNNTQIISDKGGVLADHPGFEYWAWPGISSKDGKIILGGSFKGAITLWKFSEDKAEAIELSPFEIEEHRNKTSEMPVRGIAFSANNNYCATGHADGSLIIWDLMSTKAVGSFEHNGGWINSVAVSHDGEVIVSGGGDSLLYVWKKDPGSPGGFKQSILPGHKDRIWIVAISDDGRLAASGSDDKSVRIWDIENECELKCLQKHTRWVQALAFNNSNSILASSGGDGRILLWEVSGDNSEPVTEFPGHDDSVLSLAFSGDNRHLISGSRDHSVRIWDVSKQYSNARVKGHNDRITCACYSNDGLILATGSNDCTVRLWKADTGKPTGSEFNIGSSVSSVKISPDSNSLLVGCDNGLLEIWDIKKTKMISRIEDHTTRIYSVDLSLDSKMAISADQSGNIKLWHTRTLEKLFETTVADESILSIAFSPDGLNVAAGMRSGKVFLWSIVSDSGKSYNFKELAQKHVFTAWVDGIVFSKDGKTIEARGGSWRDRQILIMKSSDLAIISVDQTVINDGAIGSFGQYRLAFGKTELAISNIDDSEKIAWYPRTLEFAQVHPQRRQWAGIQRYNLHHFRLEGGI